MWAVLKPAEPLPVSSVAECAATFHPAMKMPARRRRIAGVPISVIRKRPEGRPVQPLQAMMQA